MRELAVIVTGNVVSGFAFVGPFLDQAAAFDAAAGLDHVEWVIAPLRVDVSGRECERVAARLNGGAGA